MRCFSLWLGFIVVQCADAPLASSRTGCSIALLRLHHSFSRLSNRFSFSSCLSSDFIIVGSSNWSPLIVWWVCSFQVNLVTSIHTNQHFLWYKRFLSLDIITSHSLNKLHILAPLGFLWIGHLIYPLICGRWCEPAKYPQKNASSLIKYFKLI